MINSKSLYNRDVLLRNSKKKIGKVKDFAFIDKKCVGILIKRSDLLLIFRRKPVFTNFSNCIFHEDFVEIKDKWQLSKNFNSNKIYFYQNTNVMFETQKIGNVSWVEIDKTTGNLKNILLNKGVFNNIVLGQSLICAKDIDILTNKGCVLYLKESARIYEYNNGLATKAAILSCVVVNKVKDTSPKVIDSIQQQSDKIHNIFKDFKSEFKKGIK